MKTPKYFSTNNKRITKKTNAEFFAMARMYLIPVR
jgi:hypothetical protein